MWKTHSRISLASYVDGCISRQAYYQSTKESLQRALKEDLILEEVRNIRKNHPRMGTRKLHGKLLPFLDMHGIKLGRDGLFDLLSANYMLVRRRRRTVKTTNSFHWLRKYTNLIKGFVPTAPNQLWVSDITYWKIAEGKYVVHQFYHRRILACHHWISCG